MRQHYNLKGDKVDSELFERATKLRRQVLGPEYAESSQADKPFSRPLLDLVTQYGWGEAWGGKHLTLKMRSLLMLAMLTALNRPRQLRPHLQGAVNNGATAEEISEVLVHAAVVCGAPAALDAAQVAEEFFAQHKHR